MTSHGPKQKEWEFLTKMIQVYQYSLQKGYTIMEKKNEKSDVESIKKQDPEFYQQLTEIFTEFNDLPPQRLTLIKKVAKETAFAYHTFCAS